MKELKHDSEIIQKINCLCLPDLRDMEDRELLNCMAFLANNLRSIIGDYQGRRSTVEILVSQIVETHTKVVMLDRLAAVLKQRVLKELRRPGRPASVSSTVNEQEDEE